MGVVVGLGLVGTVMVAILVIVGTVVGRGRVWEVRGAGQEGTETNRVVVSSLQNTENHLHPTHPHPHSCLIPTRTPILTLTHTATRTHILTLIHIPIPTHPRPPSPGPDQDQDPQIHTQRPTNLSLGQRARRRR